MIMYAREVEGKKGVNPFFCDLQENGSEKHFISGNLNKIIKLTPDSHFEYHINHHTA